MVQKKKKKKEYKYQFKVAGVPYKEALPEEKWPAMASFLAELEHNARIAQQEGKPIHIWEFIREYIAIKQENSAM